MSSGVGKEVGGGALRPGGLLALRRWAGLMRALGNLTLLVSWLQCAPRAVASPAAWWPSHLAGAVWIPPNVTSQPLSPPRPALCSVVALATWLASGRAVWILPNVMSEELPISQIFKPLVSVSRPEEGKGRCELLAFNM